MDGLLVLAGGVNQALYFYIIGQGTGKRFVLVQVRGVNYSFYLYSLYILTSLCCLY